MVGFLAGLVLGQADGQPTDLRAPRTHDRAEPSALVSPRTRKSKAASDSSMFWMGIIDHINDSLPPLSGSTVRASSSRTQGVQGHTFTSSGQTDNIRPPNVHASPARAYLRHIASAPNIPRGRHLGERVPTAVAKKSVTSLKDVHHTQHSPLPPMPTSWLETVARAVLNFPGARIGGPNGASSESSLLLSPGRTRSGHSSLPSSRSGTVRGRGRPNWKHVTSPLGDSIARLRDRSTPSLPTSSNSLHPPTLVAMRSHASLGQVVRVNVVCRSAPASRSSSVVGRKPGSDSPASASFGNISSGSLRGRGRASQLVDKKHRRNNQERPADSGLSLRGRVEGDFTLRSPEDRDSYDSSSEDEDEGEDEDEVDLSKLLVHTRRQRSIKSLRRHLERAPKPRDGDDDSSHGNETWTRRGGDDSATASDSGGRIRRGSVNDGDWGVLLAPGTGRDSRSLHRRRGIPGSWMQQSGSSRR